MPIAYRLSVGQVCHSEPWRPGVVFASGIAGGGRAPGRDFGLRETLFAPQDYKEFCPRALLDCPYCLPGRADGVDTHFLGNYRRTLFRPYTRYIQKQDFYYNVVKFNRLPL